MAALATLWIFVQSLAQQTDHDESQYVAGAFLALDGLPFRDFMLLQPPLHAWLFAPLAWARPTDGFIMMRLATGLLALLTLALVYRAQRSLGLPRKPAAVATLLMGCCASFQFCAGVVRNDMLAAMLLSLGLLALVQGEAGGGRRWLLLAGVEFGLGVATKLSIAPPTAAAGLHLLLNWRSRPQALPLFAGGVLAGLLPAIGAFVLAPEAFGWGVFTFAATAPFDWYARIGAAHELTAEEKLTDLAGYMLVGPALFALLIVAGWAVRQRAWRSAPDRLLLLLILGGVAGAALPTPTHKQYLLPLLPPLFVALGVALDASAARWAGWRNLLLFGSALVGLAPAASGMVRSGAAGAPALSVDQTGDEVRRTMQAHGLSGSVASLSPERAADSGLSLDPLFATGPFVLRSGDLLDPSLAARLALPVPASLEARMRARPPGAILVGYERPHRPEGRALDRRLAVVAERMGWRAVPLPDGQGTLWLPLRPGS